VPKQATTRQPKQYGRTDWHVATIVAMKIYTKTQKRVDRTVTNVKPYMQTGTRPVTNALNLPKTAK
jgi:hypothetical protein